VKLHLASIAVGRSVTRLGSSVRDDLTRRRGSRKQALHAAVRRDASPSSLVAPAQPERRGRPLAPRHMQREVAAAPDLSAPRWRREPYRLLFPLGAALALAAVLPFAARGAAGGGSLALFHSVAQIEGFLTCFVAGFLYTFVPRRTGGPGPEAWQMAAATALPIAAVATAWADEPVAAHALWLLLVLIVLGFTLARWRAAARRSLPAVFLWVPLSLLAGAAGAALVAGAPLLDSGGGVRPWTVGRGLLTQGLVAGLVLGTAGALVGEQRHGGEAEPRAAARTALALHAAAAFAFFGSFALPPGLSARAGAGVRALTACGVLAAAGVLRPPAGGLHRRLAWGATWLVPAGFALEALATQRLRGAALHVLFVGGFAQLTLAMAVDVVLGPGDGPAARARWPLRIMAALLAAAFGARILAGLDVRRVAAWLAVAALAFAGALAAWALLVAVALRGAGRARCPAPSLHLGEVTVDDLLLRAPPSMKSRGRRP
jgi:uncharacterized protein involved in response to NO